MWIPKDEAEIITATSNATLEETTIFDAKREIPAKGIDLAKDASAFANTAGGTIVFGIDEDASGRPTIPIPFELKGERERIDSIIRTSVSEVPSYQINQIESVSDPSKGYLVLIIPPSERAPHQVVVKGDRRFYARGETQNYVLSEAEIARLYERREITKQSILPILEEIIQESPMQDHNGFAHLYIAIKPVIQDEDILEKALLYHKKHSDLLNEIISKVNGSDYTLNGYPPIFYGGTWLRRDDGFLNKMADSKTETHEKYTLYLEANFDGSGSLICSRAAETMVNYDDKLKCFLSDIVAEKTVKFLAFFGEIYKRANYFGMIDVAVGLTGLEDSIEYNVRSQVFSSSSLYTKSEYRKTRRVSAIELYENPKKVASDLLIQLISAVSFDKYNPFK